MRRQIYTHSLCLGKIGPDVDDPGTATTSNGTQKHKKRYVKAIQAKDTRTPGQGRPWEMRRQKQGAPGRQDPDNYPPETFSS